MANESFDQQYRQDRRLYLTYLSFAWACAAALTAVFAFATSLPGLRTLSMVICLIPLPFLIAGLLWMPQQANLKKAVAISGLAILASWGLTALSWASDGLYLGHQRALIDLEQPEISAAAIEASRDSEETAILNAIDRARNNPNSATFRALVPYLDNTKTNVVMPDGSLRNTSSVIREVLWADRQLLFRSLHEEALAMASLLPASDIVPDQIEINVAERLEYALKTLITAHSEEIMATAFDVPTVGMNIRVGSADDQGNPQVSNREMGITYPFAGTTVGDTVFANAGSINALLEKIQADLKY